MVMEIIAGLGFFFVLMQLLMTRLFIEPRPVYGCRLMPKFFKQAVTIYPFIFFRQPWSAVHPWLEKHEKVHIYQVKRLGWSRFYLTYFYYQLRYGYDKNPFEVEAYEISGRGES